MKTNPDYILREIAGETILVPSGEASKEINGLINLNPTAAFIWKNINIVSSTNELIEKLLEEFEIDEETAAQDVHGLLKELIQVGMVFE